MNFRLFFNFVLFIVVGVFAASPTTVIGVVLEAESDLPVKDVAITYQSGKRIGETDSRGRFELTVDSKNASLVFKKEGYDSVFVELQDFADLLDMVITLSTNVTNLGASTIIGDGEPVKWEVERTVQLEKLEDAAGMRFDLTEHLSQMPGVSGQKDFSSALYYDGSRASDVAYHLGRLRIPNMRHLDVGFPGNLSVVNPHTLSGIEIHDHYGQGPLGQGLATSIQYIPEQTSGEWGLKGSAGTTLREVVLDAPFFIWDSFRFAFRFLDDDMLKNLGEKFYTEFRKRDDKNSDAKVQSSDPFDLTAFDVYAQLNGSDSLGNASWALRTLYSSDEYKVSQDTSSTYGAVNSIDIIEGSQSYLVVGAEYASKFGTSFHAGLVRESLSDTIRDTTGFRSGNFSDASAKTFIDGYSQTHTTLSAGADRNFNADIFGADLRGAVLYEHHMVERSFPIPGGEESSDYQTGVLSGAVTLDWKNNYSEHMLSVGAVADAADHKALPTASFDMERNLSKTDSAYWRLFGNAAYRADWKHYFDDGDLTGRLESGTSLKLGLGYRSKYLVAQVSGFGRFYFDPLLPLPKAFANYQDVTPVNNAWVTGASGSLEWKTSHHFSMAMNASSVYGEYELDGGKSLPWEANSRLDVVSHFRYYPRKDSIVSVILTHHAAWHRPLYYYAIKPAASGKGGTRELRDYHKFTDMYRTDVRVNLDLTKSKFFFRHARFYLEVDNIFAKLDVDALKFLGAENDRERSWVAQDKDDKTGNGYNLVPFIAKGMGLYVQFGVEVQLGI
ncbi:hypothetical protein SAMN06298224_0473 [Fibrobacter sp. UWB16]|uniref:hypothetical protein n=1 Tax=Fibrobacter sp. UWB16 TaxID=1945874 RepID=UPI000BD1E119|nr:hypothetical protein [Fibrobacter sp. UWB16]SOD12028.1 hypothetical protein SAMN06298224_0473 [Fibrobacter sp. UWB16]